MSIDEFGQFRRKKTVRRNDPHSRQEAHREALTVKEIFGHIKAFFLRSGSQARIQQVLTSVLWLIFILVLAYSSSLIGLVNTLIMSVIYIIPVLFIQLLCIIPVSNWIETQIRRRRYDNMAIVIVPTLIIISFVVIIFLGNKSDNSSSSDSYKEPKYSDIHTRKYIGDEIHYCNKKHTSVHASLDDYGTLEERMEKEDKSTVYYIEYKDAKMEKGDKCTVLSSIGDFYEIAREEKAVGYVHKSDLTLLYTIVNDSLIEPVINGMVFPAFEKRWLDSAEQKIRYSRKLNIDKFTDGQVYQQIQESSYAGYVNSRGEKHGSGSYGWGLDSVYIGNWQNGVMTGYGMMYYYKTGKEKNGIWKYNNLITPHRALKDDVKSGRVDSALVVRISMITAKLKYNL